MYTVIGLGAFGNQLQKQRLELELQIGPQIDFFTTLIFCNEKITTILTNKELKIKKFPLVLGH